MTWIIAKKEFLENVLSLKFIISFVLCFVLIILSFYTLVGTYEEGELTEDDIADLITGEREC